MMETYCTIEDVDDNKISLILKKNTVDNESVNLNISYLLENGETNSHFIDVDLVDLKKAIKVLEKS